MILKDKTIISVFFEAVKYAISPKMPYFAYKMTKESSDTKMSYMLIFPKSKVGGVYESSGNLIVAWFTQ